MTGKYEYLPINTIDEIDVDKITLRDINKRYIDRNGMRYATRFNLETRKIEIVRIVKGMQEAELVRREIQRKKQEQENAAVREKELHRAKPVAHPEFVGEPGDLNDGSLDYQGGDVPEYEITTSVASGAPRKEAENFSEGGQFYEGRFMEECSQDFDKVKERLTGIKNFIKNSRYFETNRSAQLEEILRDLDIECLQRCDSAVNYYKELISYPRQVSYYMSRMTPEQKKKTDMAANEEEKMTMVRRWEIQSTFSETYQVIIKITNKLNDILQAVGEENLNNLPSLQKQSFKDALAAVAFLIQNCEERLDKIEKWRKRYA